MPGLRREDVRPPERPSFLTGVPVFLGFTKPPGDPADATGGDEENPRDEAHPGRVFGPERLARFGDLATVSPPADSALADAVRGFFANGGGTCYVAWTIAGDDPVGAVRRSLAALDDVDEVDLVCLPDLAAWSPKTDTGDTSAGDTSAEAGAGEAGVSDTSVVKAGAGAREPTAQERLVFAAQRAALEHCAARGDRFAVLDAGRDADVETVKRQRGWLAGPDAAFGAIYHPWLRVLVDGVARSVPPCGHIAGTYAAGDREKGVHRAPANREIEGVLDVYVDLSDDDAADLYGAGVNPVLALPGRGIRAWGVRTASDDEDWHSITVRRLVSTIGRWAERFLATAVHEPNDVRLWVRIMRELTAVLEVLHLSGAFAGTTADESFYVKCDHETNPPESVAAGLVITEIGVAPAVSAEFIVVRVIQSAGEVTVNAA